MKTIKVIFAISSVVLLSLNQSLAQEEFTQEASVYALGRYGKKMANDAYLSSRHRTCSHAFLPMGSLIKITNLGNNHSEVVEVNGKSQTTDLELTHSVAHDLGLSSSNRVSMKVLVLSKSEESSSYSLSPEAERQDKILTIRSQNSAKRLSFLNNTKPHKIAIRNKNEFSMVFPQYEPIKFDSITKKYIANGKRIIEQDDNPIHTEKIIMR